MSPLARPQSRDDLARLLARAACAGAAALLRVRRARDVKLKADGSPVCSADLAADHAAKRVLSEVLPLIPVISEESTDAVSPEHLFILLDPLDGTREFLADGDSYCVAIAAIEAGRPIAGAIAAPILGRLWFAGEQAYEQDLDGEGVPVATPQPIAVRAASQDGPVALVSRFHGDPLSDAVVTALAGRECRPVSSAVKFGLIASGEADLHVRGGQTMEWDIAAGDAILHAAGGTLMLLDGSEPRYGVSERGYRNPPFVAAGSEALAKAAVSAAADRTVVSAPR